jgi:hypothetical protein
VNVDREYPPHPSRREYDGQIGDLRREIEKIHAELAHKATHEDVNKLSRSLDYKCAELKEALKDRVTLDRFRPTEWAVMSAVLATCSAVLAFLWNLISSGRGN